MNTEEGLVSSSRTPGEYSNWWLLQNEHCGAYIYEVTPPNVPAGRWVVLPVPEAEIQEVPEHERNVWRSRLAQPIYKPYVGTPDRIGMIGKYPIMLDLNSVAPAHGFRKHIGAAWRLICRLWDSCLTTWHRAFHPVGIGFAYSGSRFCLKCRRSYPTPFAPTKYTG